MTDAPGYDRIPDATLGSVLYDLLRCQVCRALVYRGDTARHDEWHGWPGRWATRPT